MKYSFGRDYDKKLKSRFNAWDEDKAYSYEEDYWNEYDDCCECYGCNECYNYCKCQSCGKKYYGKKYKGSHDEHEDMNWHDQEMENEVETEVKIEKIKEELEEVAVGVEIQEIEEEIEKKSFDKTTDKYVAWLGEAQGVNGGEVITYNMVEDMQSTEEAITAVSETGEFKVNGSGEYLFIWGMNLQNNVSPRVDLSVTINVNDVPKAVYGMPKVTHGKIAFVEGRSTVKLKEGDVVTFKNTSINYKGQQSKFEIVSVTVPKEQECMATGAWVHIIKIS